MTRVKLVSLIFLYDISLGCSGHAQHLVPLLRRLLNLRALFDVQVQLCARIKKIETETLMATFLLMRYIVFHVTKDLSHHIITLNLGIKPSSRSDWSIHRS